MIIPNLWKNKSHVPNHQAASTFKKKSVKSCQTPILSSNPPPSPIFQKEVPQNTGHPGHARPWFQETERSTRRCASNSLSRWVCRSNSLVSCCSIGRQESVMALRSTGPLCGELLLLMILILMIIVIIVIIIINQSVFIIVIIIIINQSVYSIIIIIVIVVIIMNRMWMWMWECIYIYCWSCDTTRGCASKSDQRKVLKPEEHVLVMCLSCACHGRRVCLRSPTGAMCP